MGSSAASVISESTMLMTSCFIRKRGERDFLMHLLGLEGASQRLRARMTMMMIVVRTEEGGREPFDGSARVEGGVSAGLQSF